MKAFAGLIIALVLIGVVIVSWQAYVVTRAHSSFDNYYAFRGCSQLLTRTATSATCALPSGKDITIVEYENKWYLQNDLPCPGSLLSPARWLCMI